ncbi:hypothetical protein RvY_09174-2 [Ramazzottius varieornatus]|nr:hypothetical protein RvY_09174-2 [Ramazzottius varieornatus]
MAPQESATMAEQVLQALNLFHNTTDEDTRKTAERFLEDFESTDAAWEVCHLLLENSVDLKCKHFAARTFKSKVLKSFADMSDADQLGLRDMVFHHVNRVNGKDERAVMVALCVALADIALQMPSWNDAVSDVIARYGENSSYTPILLELLTVIPEEMTDEKLKLSASRRKYLQERLKQNGARIVALLNGMINRPDASKDADFMAKIYDCLGIWADEGALTVYNALHTPLLQNLFLYLSDINTPVVLHESCARCLSASMQDFVKEASSSKSKLKELVESTLRFEEHYCITLQKEDVERCKNYVRVFAELAECLVKENEERGTDIFEFPRLLDLLLVCCNHPEHEVVEMVIDVWPIMYESTTGRGKKNRNGEVLKDCFLKLLLALWKSCRPDPDGDWIAEKDDEFQDYRKHVAEIVFEICPGIGYRESWEALVRLMSANQNQWDAVESSLFLMSSVASQMAHEDSSLVSPIIGALTSMPTIPKVGFQHTILNFFGYLAPWFERNNEYTDKVLTIIVNSLPVQKLSDPATWALQEMSFHCRSHMVKYFHEIMSLLGRLERQGLTEDEMASISNAAVNILNDMPQQSQLQCLKEICDIVRTPLRDITTSARNGQISKSDTARLIIWINHLAEVFKHLDVKSHKDIIVELVHTLWPLLADVAQLFLRDQDVMEKVIRALRYMVRFLGKESGVSVLPVFAKFTDLYTSAPQSSMLYLASVLVDEFGELPDMREGFASMLESLSPATFNLLNSENAVRQNPDIVADYFRTCKRLAEKAFIVLVLHPRLQDIMRFSLLCSESTSQEANHAVFAFWESLLQAGRNCIRGTNPDDNRGQPVMRELLRIFASEMESKALLGVYLNITTAIDAVHVMDPISGFEQEGLTPPGMLDYALRSVPAPRTNDGKMPLMESHLSTFREVMA